MKNLTLRQLRIFCEVAKRLSFHQAAEALHLTPPAVSMQIKELETQVGLPLFDRSGRNVSLTFTGEYLLVHAKKILGSVQDAEDMVERFRGLKGGRLKIGMVGTARYFLLHLLAKFRAEHPAIHFSLEVGNRQQIVDKLLGQEVDLAVMGRPPNGVGIRAERFAQHPLVLIAAPNHPFANCDFVPALSFAQATFLAREAGSGTRATLDQYFHEHHVEPGFLMEMESNETIKQGVMAGLGVGLTSLHVVSLELQSGRLCVPEVEGMPILRHWHIAHSHNRTLSPMAEAFRYFLLEQGEPWLQHEFGTLQPPPASRDSDDWLD